MVLEDVLKDWRVYVAAAVVAVAGLVYSCNKRFETGSYVQISDTKQISHQCDDCIKLDEQNYRKFSKSLDEITAKGACFTRPRMSALLSVADINEDDIIDDTETENLCRYYLNPNSFFGKLALPYSGPESPPEPSGIKDYPKLDGPVASRALIQKYLLTLTDEDEDCMITEKEVLRMAYKIKMAFGSR